MFAEGKYQISTTSYQLRVTSVQQPTQRQQIDSDAPPPETFFWYTLSSAITFWYTSTCVQRVCADLGSMLLTDALRTRAPLVLLTSSFNHLSRKSLVLLAAATAAFKKPANAFRQACSSSPPSGRTRSPYPPETVSR